MAQKAQSFFGSVDGDGVTLGLQAGYNWQVGVFGVEGGINWADINSSSWSFSSLFPAALGPQRVSSDIEWFGAIRGRIGHAFDRFLLGHSRFRLHGRELPHDRGADRYPVARRRARGLDCRWRRWSGLSPTTGAPSSKHFYGDTGRNQISDVPPASFTVETQSFHLARLGIDCGFY